MHIQVPAVSAFILERFDARYPASSSEIASYIDQGFGLHLLVDSVHHMIAGMRQSRVVKRIPIYAH
jgi:hypothetical protein